MRLMLDANILSVFIGIESPNDASLVETKKHQNVKCGRTLVERVRAVQQSGLEVWAGMIAGFDHDDETVFDAQAKFLRDAGIAQAMVGMLYAIPKTPLYARLAGEGRIDDEDLAGYGTNMVPARMSRQALREGYVWLMKEIYRPEAYFERLAASLGNGTTPFAPARARHWRRHPVARFKEQARNMARAAVLYGRLMRHIDDNDTRLRRRYRSEVWRQLRQFRDPGLVLGYLMRCAMHYHHFTLARSMAGVRTPLVN